MIATLTANAAESADDVLAAVQDMLDSEIRPLLHVHGGDVRVKAVTDGEVRLEFLSACRGCMFKSWTLLVAIESRLLRVPGIRAVRADGVAVSRAARERTLALLRGVDAGGGEV